MSSFSKFENPELARRRALKPRPGYVLVQWKCRDKHKDCHAPTWRPWMLVPAAQAKQAVKDNNLHTPLFAYRVKP